MVFPRPILTHTALALVLGVAISAPAQAQVKITIGQPGKGYTMHPPVVAEPEPIDMWPNCRSLCGGVPNYCPPSDFVAPAPGQFTPGPYGRTYNLCYYWRDHQINPLNCQPLVDRYNLPDGEYGDLFDDDSGQLLPRSCSNLVSNLRWDLDEADSALA
jgi:hypothetical protein